MVWHGWIQGEYFKVEEDEPGAEDFGDLVEDGECVSQGCLIWSRDEMGMN